MGIPLVKCLLYSCSESTLYNYCKQMLYTKKIHQRCQATERYRFTRGWGWSALTANYCCEVQYKLTMECVSVRAVSRRSLGKFGSWLWLDWLPGMHACAIVVAVHRVHNSLCGCDQSPSWISAAVDLELAVTKFVLFCSWFQSHRCRHKKVIMYDVTIKN